MFRCSFTVKKQKTKQNIRLGRESFPVGTQSESFLSVELSFWDFCRSRIYLFHVWFVFYSSSPARWPSWWWRREPKTHTTTARRPCPAATRQLRRRNPSIQSIPSTTTITSHSSPTTTPSSNHTTRSATTAGHGRQQSNKSQQQRRRNTNGNSTRSNRMNRTNIIGDHRPDRPNRWPINPPSPITTRIPASRTSFTTDDQPPSPLPKSRPALITIPTSPTRIFTDDSWRPIAANSRWVAFTRCPSF